VLAKTQQPNAEGAKETQKAQKKSFKGMFFCAFCGSSAPSAFGIWF
jgi:hypothetical protein